MLVSTTRSFWKLYRLGYLAFFIVWLSCSNAATGLHNSLDADREVLVVAAFQVPFVMSFTKGPGRNITSKSGVLVDVLDWVAEHSKFGLQYSIIETYEFGPSGGLPIAAARLLNGEVDLSISLNPTEDRIGQMDFSYPVTCDPFYFMLPFPDEESRLATIFTFLSPSAALVSLLSIATLAGVLCVYYWMHKPSDSRSHSVSDTVWSSLVYAFTSFTGGSGLGHSFIMPYNIRLPFRLGIGLSLLMVLVLTNIFSGVLTSRMTALKYKPIVNSFQELVDHPRYKLVQPVDSHLGIIIYNSTTGIWKKLRDSMRKVPFEVLYANFTPAVRALLLEYNGVTAMSKGETRLYIGDDMKKHPGKCRFTRSKPLDSFKCSLISTRKGFKNSHIISKSLQYLAGYGLMDYWIQTSLPNIDKCIVKDSFSVMDEVREASPLQVSHFHGAFLLLGAGLLFAFLVLLCERYRFKYNQRKKEISSRHRTTVQVQQTT